MPNWCNNSVELYHADPAMIERARAAFNDGKFLNEFIPVPESLNIVAGSVGDPDEQRKLEEATAQNLVDHGYGNWYDFCVGEWGTKWDVGADGMEPGDYTGPNGEKGLILSFDSAWAPPIQAYEKLMDLGFVIRAFYYEPGMCFAGIWEDGNDDYYDMSGMDSEQAAEELPAELDEMFAISENMAEWEAEQDYEQSDDGA